MPLLIIREEASACVRRVTLEYWAVTETLSLALGGRPLDHDDSSDQEKPDDGLPVHLFWQGALVASWRTATVAGRGGGWGNLLESMRSRRCFVAVRVATFKVRATSITHTAALLDEFGSAGSVRLARGGDREALVLLIGSIAQNAKKALFLFCSL